MKKAVFLDRDGVINSDRGHYYIYKVEDFVINQGIFDGLKRLSEAGFLLVVISNQGGVAKGLYSKQEVEKVHDFLKAELKKQGVELAEIYYCPHHPSQSACLCRKPDSLMIEKALARFEIDAAGSYLIGDSPRDIRAAEKAGIKGLKIEANQNISEVCSQILTEGAK